MKKNRILWMFAMLMLAVGISSCSSDDEDVAIYDDNPTTLDGTWYLVKANFGWGGYS